MLRSLFTGISGLRAHQQMLDVTSNNIANVNTAGYKTASVVFQDTLSQTIGAATLPNGAAGRGGINARQIGLGVQLAATSNNFTQGSNQYTGVASDTLINGDGFFVVNSGGATNYTRAGAFKIDGQGNLTTPDGSLVQGATNYDAVAHTGTHVAPTAGTLGTINLSDLSNPAAGYTSWGISSNGDVVGTKGDGTTQVLATIAVANFTNPNGLVKTGNTQFQASNNSGALTIDAPGAGGRGTLTSGYVEMSNVDLSQEMTNLIISQRGFQANSRSITTSDNILQELIDLKR